MKKQYLLSILFFGFLLSIFSLFNLISQKDTKKNSSTPINNPIVLKKQTEPVVSSQKTKCFLSRALNTESSNILTSYLNKNNTQYYIRENKEIYEIYWNLGKNKEIAKKLFLKQKNKGFLNENHNLVLYKNDWTVSIALINSEDDAKKNTLLLAEKGKRAKFGGGWFYRYVDTFKVFQFTSNETTQKFLTTININTLSCN